MSGLRLFCFPYGGAGASGYRLWSRQLPAWIEISPVELPGRERRYREPPHTRLKPLVAELAGSLDFRSGPFAFFGHSLGGLIAFELARELRRRGMTGPRVLIASAYPAPQLHRDRPHVAHLPDAEMLATLKEHFDVAGDWLDDPALVELALPVLRADMAVVESYEYEPAPPLEIPLAAFGGIGDPEASEEQIRSWRDQSTQRFWLRMFPGGHFFLNTGVPAVLRELTEILGTVRPSGG